MSFRENCENGTFLPASFNGTVDGFLVGPDFYSNPLNFLQRILFGIVFLFLTVVSLIGNGFALFTISNGRLQVLYRCCVVSQCVGDILMAVFVGLNSLNNFIQDTIDWKFGDFMCGWIPFVTTMSALLSSMILTCIAIDRYQGVVLLSGKWDPNLSTSAFVVAGLWLAAAGATLPTFFGYNQLPACFVNFDEKDSFFGHLCLANQTISNYYFFAVFALIFLPLLIGFVVLYSSIARTMWSRRQKEKSLDGSVSASTLDTNVDPQESPPVRLGPSRAKPRDNHSRRKVRTFVVVLVIMGTFTVCRLPQWIFIVITTLPGHRLSGSFWYAVKYSLSALSLANTAVNPFVYSCLNQVVNLKSNFVAGLKKIRLKDFRIKL